VLGSDRRTAPGWERYIDEKCGSWIRNGCDSPIFGGPILLVRPGATPTAFRVRIVRVRGPGTACWFPYRGPATDT